MAMFDVIDDMVRKETTKTETGDTLIYGVVVGTVTKNYDQEMQGRVCVTIPTRDTNANEVKWARVMMPWGGSKWGMYFMPEVGDQVLVAFEQGNIERPYVIGSVPKDSDEFLTGTEDESNQYKKIITKNGNTISLEDNKEGDGTKDKIKIVTAGNVHSLEMDNENSLIKISDQEGKNLIQMDTKDGKMQVTASGSLTVKVGENIELTMEGSSGEVTLKATKVTVSASNELSMSGTSSLKLDSGNLTASANGSLQLKSSGAVSVSGTPIKIG